MRCFSRYVERFNDRRIARDGIWAAWNDSIPRALRAIVLYAIFFLSGACALGYQMVWSRQFAIGLGHELPGVLAVVAAFFGGLATGAWRLDRVVSRSARPGCWYAGLEMLIGIWGMISIALIPVANRLANELIGLEPSGVRHWALALAIPFWTLLPATLAMGATFPAMERFASPLQRDGRCVGKLYAANTLGAVAGAVVATSISMPTIGFAKSLAVFAALNWVCAVAGWGLQAGVRAMAAPANAARLFAAAPTSQSNARLNLIIFATGMLGIGYEVLGVRVLAEVFENTVYSFAAALSVYLLGTALGAGWYQRWGRRRPFAALLWHLLAGLAAVCLVGAWTLSRSETIYETARRVMGSGVIAGSLAEAAVAALVFGMPTLVMGATYSHLVQWSRRDDGGIGRAVALNTLGSALAPLGFGVLLLPALGARWAMVAVSFGYLALLPLIMDHGPRMTDRWSRAADVRNQSSAHPLPANAGARWGLPLAAAVLVFLLPARLQFVQKPPGGEILEYRQGVMASVAAVRHFDGNRSLLVNNRFIMGGTGAANAARRHAQIPLLLHPHPKRALFLGLGTGITFAAAGTHPGLQADGVELVPEILEMLGDFAPENSVKAGLRLYAADARRFVRVSRIQYDVIVADLFHPARDGAGTLYTVEHFRAIRSHLTSGGLFCQWLPLFQLDEPTLRVITKTFLEVFPNARAYLLRWTVDTPVLGLVGTLRPTRYPANWFEERTRAPELAAALKTLALTDGFQLFGLYLAGPESLREYANGTQVNTDDLPVVLFRAPHFAYERTENSSDRLFALLDRFRADSRELIQVENDPAAAEFAGELMSFMAARDVYLRGLLAEEAGDFAKAIDGYVESARLSAHFSTGYAQCLNVAMRQSKSNPAGARALLERLSVARPDRPIAADLMRRLFP